MDVLIEIKKIKDNADKIYTLFNKKIPAWLADRRHYDKVGWGFNGDDRFNACTPAKVAFYSYSGTYGDSGCSRECHLNNELFQEYLIKYLDENREAVMLGIADILYEKAKSLKSQAEDQLQKQLDEIKQLGD